MSRLVVVSNRVATPKAAQAGGLASAMLAALSEVGGLWFGWSGKAVAGDPGPPKEETDGRITFLTTDLSKTDFEDYYNGFANRSLWPLLHFRPDLVDYSKQNYQGYQRVNRHFARTLAPHLRDGDTIWVQDFHLIPLAGLLREMGIAGRMGFFLHTPLPPPDIMRVLPGHRALMDALTEYDLVGLHTNAYVRAFVNYQRDLAGGQKLPDGWVRTGSGRLVRVLALPISVDPDAIASQAAKAVNNPSVKRLRAGLTAEDRIRLAVGVDRLDYSKGLPERFEAFGRFLDRSPQHRGLVSLLQIAPTSREDVPAYIELRGQLEQQAGAVNGRYSDPSWTPIRYVNRTYPQSTLFGFYRAACMGLVTPLRDGMNLVAKEFVAAQDPDDPGVLVLSTFAGAADEMDEAVFINPYDIDGMADAMARALDMDLPERRRRWSALMARLKRWDITTWRRAFLAALEEPPSPEVLRSTGVM